MHSIVAIVLWTAATYGFQGSSIFPRLGITSATKRCGKSTLLLTLRALVSLPIKADNISTSALFRIISGVHPTMLIDEVDSSSEDIRNILNAGFEKSGTVYRSEPTPDGKSFVPTEFSVYTPIAYAGIGGMADTVLDRSVVIRLERAPSRSSTATTRHKPMRARDLEQLRDLLAPHLVAHADAIRAALAVGTTNIPAALSDRAQDAWEPLLALADLAGATWPQEARAAAIALSAGQDVMSQREQLLADIEQTVNAKRAETTKARLAWRAGNRKGLRPRLLRRMRSSDLLLELLKMEHRPWPEFGRDSRGLTAPRLANLLRPFGIIPTSQRMPVAGPRGVHTTFDRSRPGLRTCSPAGCIPEVPMMIYPGLPFNLQHHNSGQETAEYCRCWCCPLLIDWLVTKTTRNIGKPQISRNISIVLQCCGSDRSQLGGSRTNGPARQRASVAYSPSSAKLKHAEPTTNHREK